MVAWYQVDLEMMEEILAPRINGISLWLVYDHVWKPATPMKISIDEVENSSSQALPSIPIGAWCISI
jgi:hypothetical protein